MACLIAATSCFVPGTLVHTPGGCVPIERIQVGDLVLSRAEGGAESSYRRVVNASVRENQTVIRVIFGPDDDPCREYSLYVTVDHLFWVEGAAWTPANRLRPASRLRLADGTFGQVIWLRPIFRTDRPNVGLVIVDEGEEGVGREIDFADDRNFLDYVDIDESLLDGSVEDPYFRTTVHNIDVEDFHTFHVGKAGALVRGAECR